MCEKEPEVWERMEAFHSYLPADQPGHRDDDDTHGDDGVLGRWGQTEMVVEVFTECGWRQARAEVAVDVVLNRLASAENRRSAYVICQWYGTGWLPVAWDHFGVLSSMVVLLGCVKAGGPALAV
jgi:hypothetical protein